ncbi:uncharacterized protein LOC143283367 [Babylonia areolata]|uniref:uncharacterized protein LOC143283367 n=1 Tax=Babylonia areolata TaxID=304850 RepID=UPI003FD5CFCB
MKIAVIVELLTVALVCWGLTEAITCDPACGLSECCADPFQIRGRKKRQASPSACKALGDVNDTCLFKQTVCGVGTLRDCKRYCLCNAGLKCVDTGLDEIPLGSIGVCKQHTSSP